MLLQLLKPLILDEKECSFSFHVFRNQDRFFSEALAPNYLFGNYRSSNQPYGFQRLATQISKKKRKGELLCPHGSLSPNPSLNCIRVEFP
ncbi:unnamed protein product [Brassica oleracea var. botrytis]|uniref:(rape) hypothetical protein n=1 Tax=Brassica napus TaxID=3708 RepID=A0A816R5B3_BRANA|nr:unnamed protein product [Brassica napus]